MNAARTVTIPHLGRVEGHGGIFVKILGDRVDEVNMDIHEGSRYYEVLVKGRHFSEVQGIVTRVCAICSADHTVAALAAIERALAVEESSRTRMLRELQLLGAGIESHALHLFALALPDFLGFESVLAMAGQYPTEVAFALRLKQLGNRVQGLVGGRPVHPVNSLVGGFGQLPRHSQLEELRSELANIMEPLLGTAELVAGIEVPDWATRPSVYLALRPDEDGYGFRGVTICSSAGEEHPVESYRRAIREFTVEHSHAKHAALDSGDTYMVGALARLKLWGHLLTGRARRTFERLFPNGVEENVILNNHAQLVEIVHCVEHAIELCNRLLALPEVEREVAEVVPRAGRGIAAIEAPRGTLIHEYELDGRGLVTEANIVTPTAQNLANTERDLRCAVTRLLGTDASTDALELRLGMVARAYDPCISCSVHVIRM